MDTANAKHDGAGGPAFPIVGIGASAGGLRAAGAFLDHAPDDSGMAFVLVFHLDPNHKSEAAELLQTHTRMPIEQVRGRTEVKPNHVYVIPPNHGLALIDGVLALTKLARADGRPTVIDHFFRSLAAHAGEHAIGVVLSGTGTEGSEGLKAIKEAGGLTAVQDETEAEYPGMPHSAIATGLVDFVLPVADIPAKLLEVRNFAVDFSLPDAEQVATASDAETLQKIFVQLRTRVGHDFSHYKQSTILRRIARRMQVHRVQELAAYLELLRTSRDEALALYRDLLISVTNFFRDPESMAVLAHDVLAPLCQHAEEHAVRVWAPGCATGEEAYSLAMLLSEACDGLVSPPRLQVFASDVDEHALEVARRGFYPGAVSGDVSEPRLRRFFEHSADGLLVKASLREMILFTHHDLLRDPPFSRLDLISCRNVLIYLKADIQSRIFALFHFALKSHGHLFLGSSESLGASGKLFTEVHHKARLYQSRRVPIAELQFPIPILPGTPRAGRQALPSGAPPRRFEQIAREELLARYAPPCVIVGENYNITYISGRVGRYLEPGAGEANYNILDMAREGLRLELRTALYKAFHDGGGVQRKPVRMRVEGADESVLLTVRPLADADGHALVVFEEPAADAAVPEPVAADAGDRVAAQLEAELTNTRATLQASIEELETSNEELSASNEELQSVNEELQSTTEELETGKEELQSTNEELLAVNQELRARNDELAQANGDLGNLIASTDIATLFLDSELRVRRYTPRMTGIFNLIPSDVGRPFSHLTHNLDAEGLAGDAEHVLRDLVMVERELGDRDGRFYQMRLRPYRAMDNRVDGVVVTFVDVTERSRREASLALLAEVGEELTQRADTDAVLTALGPKLAAHFGASLLALGEVDEQRQIIDVGHAWQRAGAPDWKGEHRLGDFDAAGSPATGGAGANWVMRDATVDPSSPAPPFAAFLGVPLTRGGEWRFELVLGADTPHDWREGEIALFREIAGHTWAHLEGARAGAALQQSEERFRALVMAASQVVFRMSPDWSEMLALAGRGFLAETPLPNRTWLEAYIPSDEQSRVRAEFEAAVREKRVFELEHRIIRSDGTVGWVAARAAPLLDAGGEILEWFGAAADISEQRRAARGIARLASIVASSDDAIVSKDLAGVITTWNGAAERMFGYRADEAVGRNITALIIPDDRQAEEAGILARIATGETVDHLETVRRRKDGSRLAVSVTISPLRENGRVIGASKIARDISVSKRAEEHRELLIHELNHRVKNTLATVQALATQTFRGAPTSSNLARFEARLLALSAAHDVLTRESWKGASISEIVDAAMSAWGGGNPPRVRIEGPDLRLKPEAALALAMALHELATNASKYGALSNNAGAVVIGWSIDSGHASGFRMQWREQDGPAVSEPAQRGFGSRLVEYGLAQDFGGTVALAFEPTGVVCTIAAPLDEIREVRTP